MYPTRRRLAWALNAFFVFTVVLGLGFTWQEALAMVFVCGVDQHPDYG
jgi:xanthine/uracil/vitamin C permease (AzgA family)